MKNIKQNVRTLRQGGLTYGEIQKKLHVKIPNSTLSYWCKNIVLSDTQTCRIEKLIIRNRSAARNMAVMANKIRRNKYLNSIYKENLNLKKLIRDKNIAKIALSLLYLAEGTKNQGSITFGNSNPDIILLFLHLLKQCYLLDLKKFRCTVQCRADANISALEKFWSRITGIPKNQFYKARVDARTIGKISINKDYKGVCRLDYFSAHIYNEVTAIAQILCSIAN